jgi:hypothetical protein
LVIPVLVSERVARFINERIRWLDRLKLCSVAAICFAIDLTASESGSTLAVEVGAEADGGPVSQPVRATTTRAIMGAAR